MSYIFKCLIILFSVVLLTNCENSPTSPEPDNPEIVTGTVISSDILSGTLGIDNSPYIIRKRVTIPKDSTLLIKPGVEIYFKSSEADEDFQYDDLKVGMLEVNGYIKAEGKIDSTITFSRANEKGHWGMVFIQSNDTNKINLFNYCNIEYGNKADGIQIKDPNFGTIMTNYSKIEMKDCSIDRSLKDGISCYNSIALINNNKIENSFDDGISCVNTKSEITNNRILSALNVAIMMDECFDANIVGNVILGCSDYYSDFGIFLYKSSPAIARNSIMGFSTGIRLYQSEYGSYSEPYKLLITDNTIAGNYNGIALESDAKVIPEIYNNSITNNKGTGIYSAAWYNTSIIVRHNTIDNNAKGLYAQDTYSLIVDSNIVSNNEQFGIYCMSCYYVDITNNTIFNNGFYKDYLLPGIFLNSITKSTNLVNNLVYKNNCGILSYQGNNTYITNCTIVDNKVGLAMRGSENYSDIIKNTIIYGNQISFDFTDTNYSRPVEISYSLIQDSILAPELTDMGNNLFAVDPLFVDAANNNYQLSAGSPCIDAGFNEIAELPEYDLAGNPRIVGAGIDIGAYEFQGGR